MDMKHKKALFIINPHAGKGQIRIHLLEIVDILVKAGYEVTVYKDGRVTVPNGSGIQADAYRWIQEQTQIKN